PSPCLPVTVLLKRHLITAHRQPLETGSIFDEDADRAIFELGIKNHFASVVERGPSEVIEEIILVAVRNLLLGQRDDLDAFGGLEENYAGAPAITADEGVLDAIVDEWYIEAGEILCCCCIVVAGFYEVL